MVALITTSCGDSGDSQSTTPSDVTCSELGEGWSAYHDEESGICFCYPAEWGEVIDYVDYFEELILAESDYGEISEEEMEDWESRVRDSGRFLSFSNLDMSWGTHIRITSAEKVESFISNALESYAAHESGIGASGPWLFPLLGYFSGQIVTTPDYYTLNPDLSLPDYEEELQQVLQEIVDLPEGASPEELQDTTLPLSIIFANGLRDMDLSSVTYGQIVTNDGELSGVTEIGIEGWDVGSRDYWDCILTDSNGNQLIYITFWLQSPFDEQQTQFTEFARTITLLK